MGQIADISTQGVSFHYLDLGMPPDVLNESVELAIYLGEDDLYLDHVPMGIVSTVNIDESFGARSVTMKRSFARFGILSPDQETGLRHFLSDHTNGRVQDRRHKKKSS